jgi:hypothetical protein
LDAELNKNKTKRFNIIVETKGNSIKKFQSGKNLRFGLKCKLTNSENYVKKKSEGIKEVKPFYFDMNKIFTPKDLKKIQLYLAYIKILEKRKM